MRAVALLACLGAHAAGRPFLSPLFGDHMVLQRETAAPVWGWTAPGVKVTVRFRNQEATATADAAGRWQAEVETGPAGGPFDLVADGSSVVRLTDVLVGDVWVCSGQSNMGMGLTLAQNGREEAENADHPHLRLHYVPNRTAYEPMETEEGRWLVCTPRNVLVGEWGGFSAAGYFFGRMLERDLGIPIGLVQASWGGTPAEAWTSAAALRALPWYDQELAAVAAQAGAAKTGAASFEAAMRAWYRATDAGSAAGGPGWESPALEETGWGVMGLPAHWERAGLPDFDGVVWFRKTVELPPGWDGRAATLHLGPIDDRDTVWINGVRVGETDDWQTPRDYPVLPGILRGGANVVAVRVLDTGGAGGIYGGAGELRLEAGAGTPLTPVRLAGGWRWRTGADLRQAAAPPPRRAGDPNAPTVLFHGMIAPLLPFAITGAIWYQGESNAGHPDRYRRLLPAMIRDWRARFRRGDFPFLIVQLAGWHAPPAEPAEDGWAELREAQWLTATSVPGCALVTAVDVGDVEDIHPKNKQEVGRRLGLAAEALEYGRPLEWSGPVFRAARPEGATLRLSFDHLGGGLVAKDGGPLRGFAVAGRDGRFAWAGARIDGGDVVVSSPAVAEPVAARYGWASNPACTLYGRAGLPALPFRTDPPRAGE